MGCFQPAYFAGIKVGPTERIGLLSPAAPVEAAGAAAAGASGAAAGGGVAAVVAGGAEPFLAAAGADLAAGARDIFFALSSVTMMSPCCSAAALSSMVFRASDQVCPAALQAQDGLNSVRYLNALGEA